MSIPLKRLTVTIEARREGESTYDRRSVSSTVYRLAEAEPGFGRLVGRAMDRNFDLGSAEIHVVAEWANGSKIRLNEVGGAWGEPILGPIRRRLDEEAARPIASSGAMARIILKTCALDVDVDTVSARLTNSMALDYARRAIREAFPDRAEEIVAFVENWAVAAGALGEPAIAGFDRKEASS